MAIRYRAGALLLGIAGACGASPAMAASDNDQQNLSNLSIEQLAEIPVRSASKVEEPLSTAPTALYVITNDDILRAAATSLPEALRMAPNLQVERVDSRQYAIAARGFNGIETSDKLLVLIDGRSVYSTLHSGVFWELQNPMIEDIAQIEVISGPGGTLYGPNAVNGVINVNSRDARDTLGVLARGTAGEQERTAALRYGFSLGGETAMRVYANYFDRGNLPAGFGPKLDDAIRGAQGGFRADHGPEGDQLTLQGDYYNARTFEVQGEGTNGGNVLVRWTRALDGAASFQVQAYYDVFHRRSLLTEDFLETLDGQAQLNLQAGAHQLVAGAGGRMTRDRFTNNLNIFQLAHPSARLWLVNGFVQDKIALSGKFSVTAGLKAERSSYSGLHLLPNLRLAWQPGNSHLLWAAVSRAVRTPSRIDRELSAAGLEAPAPDFQSEKLVAFEAGYRGQPAPGTSFSLSVYYNHYDDLRSYDLIDNKLPFQLRNDLEGHSYGVEAWGSKQVMPWWRLSFGASWLGKSFRVKAGARDLSNGASLGHDPDFQLQLRSAMTFDRVTIDLNGRHVDSLRSPDIPAYTEADARIGWDSGHHVELFVSGENLLHARHFESNDPQRAQAVVRTVFAGARLRF